MIDSWGAYCDAILAKGSEPSLPFIFRLRKMIPYREYALISSAEFLSVMVTNDDKSVYNKSL